MRYCIIAGESSGDMYGADLIKQIKHIDKDADFWACGGEAMQKAMGKPCALYTTSIASMGLDFLQNCYKLWQWFMFCKKNLMAYQPDAVICIDFGGFNMRLAAFAKQNGLLVYYYIPPKIWAYRKPRIARIQRNIHQVYSILPFEVASYQAYGYASITYVGHPLVNMVENHVINHSFIEANELDQRPIIALLPGSRIGEIKRILPVMVTQAVYFNTYQFVVAGLSCMPRTLYKKIVPPTVRIVYDQTYDLLAMSKAAIVASGTATLETALWNVPQIVVYKTSWLTYAVYKRILTLSHISLVNLLVNQAAVPELIQDALTENQLSKALTQLLREEASAQQQSFYKQIRQLLGKKRAAVEVARLMVADRMKQPPYET
ncbi:MAG: lipid-A-disaccharide synthase [Candidatus Cardinium sp.]|nr:lipid-A-disaccharide synthase [Candidatus Cardinium sp.]